LSLSAISERWILWIVTSVVVLASVFSNGCFAAIPTETFDAGSWKALTSSKQRPMVVVFATTDCMYCPKAIEAISKEIEQRKSKATLVTVVMDGQAHPELLESPHFKLSKRLMVFSGLGPQLQYSVDPRWRGTTPYIAFFNRHGESWNVTGSPKAMDYALVFR